MSRRARPGPKSRIQRRTVSGFGLGDTSTDSERTEVFQSPERAENETDYGLDFTSEVPRLVRHTSRGQTRTPAQTTVRQSRATRPETVRRPRKQKTPQARNRLFLKEMRILQASTQPLVPRLPFGRLVRELIQQMNPVINRVSITALEALQVATEYYITQRMQDAYMLTLHRGRVTLSVKDLELINFLRSSETH